MGERVESYRDLRVWQRAMDLAERVYVCSRSFPSDERFGLTAQVRRAAVSIASNIAEGWGRGATKEYIQFLRYVRGSLYEVETQLLIAESNGFIDVDAVADVLQGTDDLGRMLLGLIRSLKAA